MHFCGEFKECDLDNVLFEKCNFTVSKFRDSSLQKVVFYACAICGRRKIVSYKASEFVQGFGR